MSAADPVPPPAGGAHPHAAGPADGSAPAGRPAPSGAAAGVPDHVTADHTASNHAASNHAPSADSASNQATSNQAASDDPAPPELPPVRADLAHIVIPSTVVWFVAFVVLLFFLDDLRAHQAMIWLWTCLAGGVLGLIGLAVYGWQRRAARQGRRSANAMALQERW